MSGWSQQPLGLAWEWRQFCHGNRRTRFPWSSSPSWSFSSANIPWHCVIVQNGTLTTEPNLSGSSFRTLSIPSGRKPDLRDKHWREVHVIQKKEGGLQMQLGPGVQTTPPSFRLPSVSLSSNLVLVLFSSGTLAGLDSPILYLPSSYHVVQRRPWGFPIVTLMRTHPWS